MTAGSLALREECDRVIDTIYIPRPFNITEFLDALAQQRNKPIELVPANLGATAPCGMLVGTDDVDYICYAANTTTLHARHIVVHEAGHLVFGHQGTAVEPVIATDTSTAISGRTAEEMQVLRTLMPNLTPHMIRALLGRTVYHQHDEQQAELFASMVFTRCHRSRHADIAPDADLARILPLFDQQRVSMCS